MTFLFGWTAYWCMRWPHSINTFVFVLLLCIFVLFFFYLWFWIVGISLNKGMCVCCPFIIIYICMTEKCAGCYVTMKTKMKGKWYTVNYARKVVIRIEPSVLSPCKNCSLHSLHMICTFSVAIKLHNEEFLWTNRHFSL